MKKIILGVTGASGAFLAYEFLKLAHKNDIEIHLVLSECAKLTICHELSFDVDRFYEFASVVYDNSKLESAIASGSFKMDAMIILPTSMKTLAGINSGYSDTLLLRAADVCIKEGRRLILAPRETPLSQIHLKNLYKLSKLQNVFIVPPMMSFYSNPTNINEMVFHYLCKLFSLLEIDIQGYKRWS